MFSVVQVDFHKFATKDRVIKLVEDTLNSLGLQLVAEQGCLGCRLQSTSLPDILQTNCLYMNLYGR